MVNIYFTVKYIYFTVFVKKQTLSKDPYWVQPTVHESLIYTIAQLLAALAVFSAPRAVFRSDSQLVNTLATLEYQTAENLISTLPSGQRTQPRQPLAEQQYIYVIHLPLLEPNIILLRFAAYLFAVRAFRRA